MKERSDFKRARLRAELAKARREALSDEEKRALRRASFGPSGTIVHVSDILQR